MIAVEGAGVVPWSLARSRGPDAQMGQTRQGEGRFFPRRRARSAVTNTAPVSHSVCEGVAWDVSQPQPRGPGGSGFGDGPESAGGRGEERDSAVGEGAGEGSRGSPATRLNGASTSRIPETPGLGRDSSNVTRHSPSERRGR